MVWDEDAVHFAVSPGDVALNPISDLLTNQYNYYPTFKVTLWNVEADVYI